MYKLTLSLALAISMTACSSLSEWQYEEENGTSTKVEETMEPEHIKFQRHYRGNVFQAKNRMLTQSHEEQQDINYYVRGMMQELVTNLQYVNDRTAMAVTSFVFLDGSYEYSDIVGKQLSESFVHEIHKYGIPIVDFKATDYIRVTPNGDFVLSKDFLDLSGDLPVKYVLTGTLVKQPTGYLVNARVVGMKSKAIVATSQGKLPSHVINSLISSDKDTGALLLSSK